MGPSKMDATMLAAAGTISNFVELAHFEPAEVAGLLVAAATAHPQDVLKAADVRRARWSTAHGVLIRRSVADLVQNMAWGVGTHTRLCAHTHTHTHSHSCTTYTALHTHTHYQ